MRKRSLFTTGRSGRRDGERGQILPLTVLSMVVILAMLGLLVDGGIAFAHQRQAQNGADAAANAGGVVLAQWVTNRSGALQDAAVLTAISSSATSNGLEGATAEYTNALGQTIGVTVGQAPGGSIPNAARGVRVGGGRTGEVTFAHVIGFSSITASADATAVVGKLAGCQVASPCNILPVTFPVSVDTCTTPHQTYFPPGNPGGGGGTTWPLTPLDQAVSPAGDATMVNVALCTNASGSVGWLDLRSGLNLQQEISTPYPGQLNLPDWFQTKTGNVNSVQNELDAYNGKVVLIPLWTDLCRSYPGSPTAQCSDPQPPNGNNLWYHIPQFVAFKIYRTYVQANNIAQCSTLPGQPPVVNATSGFIGCFKGWFTQIITQGPISLDSDPQAGDSVGLTLIR